MNPMIQDDLAPIDHTEQIRSSLTGMKGDLVAIKANMGRSKVLERQGTVLETHPELFIVKVHEKRNRTIRASYQYVDVLTGVVELFDPESGESLFPWVAELG